MKTLTIILLLTLLCACNTLKRSHSTVSESTQQKSQHSWSYNFYQDSSASVWLLDTDSPFFFHPEYGLWARSGQLWQQEYYQKRLLEISHVDSTSYTHAAHVEKEWERKKRIPQTWIIVVFVVLVGYLLYYLCRRISV